MQISKCFKKIFKYLDPKIINMEMFFENVLKQNCPNKYSQMTILHELLRFSSNFQGLNQENIPAKKQMFAKSEIKNFNVADRD